MCLEFPMEKNGSKSGPLFIQIELRAKNGGSRASLSKYWNANCHNMLARQLPPCTRSSSSRNNTVLAVRSVEEMGRLSCTHNNCDGDMAHVEERPTDRHTSQVYTKFHHRRLLHLRLSLLGIYYLTMDLLRLFYFMKCEQGWYPQISLFGFIWRRWAEEEAAATSVEWRRCCFCWFA